MRKIVLEIAYIGTNYNGWQKQPNKYTIQETIEKCYKSALDEDITLYASGRTDAGVHAYQQVAHFETKSTIPAEKFAYILNAKLPDDIRITKSCEVDEHFHARFSAKCKTYVYKVYNSPIPNPFYNNRALQIEKCLNIKKMRQGAKVLKGTHDFTSFCKTYKEEKDCSRTIYFIKIKKDTKTNVINIEVCGQGFLRNMVRIICGALIDVGLEKTNIHDLKYILENKDRKLASKTLPAYALYLSNVKY